jgi:hypothetical protein
MQYDHLGIPTTVQQPREIWVALSRVWVTDAHLHPFGVEWLRFEPDSPVTGPLRERPHLGFRVNSREEITTLSRGMKVLLEPFDAGFCVAGFYETHDGVSIELVWYYDEMTAWAERTQAASPAK